VILCGGSGTRLWPLSRKSIPKQFVPLIDGKSLLELTLERVAQMTERTPNVICVAAEEHRFFVADAMRAAGTSGAVVLEPCARNTAPAMALAALLAASRHEVSQGEHASPQDQLLLFCPADHHIPDVQAFAAMVEGGVEAAAAGAVVTFGVTPTYHATGYGYIETEGDAGAPARSKAAADATANAAADPTFYTPPLAVKRFIEKPSQESAMHMILAGHVFWNAGIFLASAATVLEALKTHAPDILEATTVSMRAAKVDHLSTPLIDFVRPSAAEFEQCRAESIDYAVMEKHQSVMLVPFRGQWSDVGSWSAVAALSPADEQGNRTHGQGITIESTNTFVHAPNRPVVTLGTDALLVIDTPDALLVVAKTHTEQVKHVVAELERRDSPQAGMHRKVARPWGWYDSIDMGDRFQVKRISVKPGASLSLQMHHHRAEHWVVVRGTARVTRGDEVVILAENQSTYIPLGVKHRLENPGKTDLEIIEVQSGAYLGEDDIVRFEDHYGRS
jgi:mannose-1-phosphate guanylyltransferase/mannose-6-phosphate isomerase